MKDAEEFKAVLELLGMTSILENCSFDSLKGVTTNRYIDSDRFRLPKNIIVREHSSPINDVDSKQGDLKTKAGNDISLSLVAEKDPLAEEKCESPKMPTINMAKELVQNADNIKVTETNPFNCDTCDIKANMPDSFKAHQLFKHGNVEQNSEFKAL